MIIKTLLTCHYKNRRIVMKNTVIARVIIYSKSLLYNSCFPRFVIDKFIVLDYIKDMKNIFSNA